MTPDWLFIAPHFGDPWVMQFARNVTEVDDGLNRATFVTHTDQMAHAKLSHNRQNSQTSATMTSHLV